MTKLMTLFLATLIIALRGAAEKPVAPATKTSRFQCLFFVSLVLAWTILSDHE
jgi:hypothetical protein